MRVGRQRVETRDWIRFRGFEREADLHLDLLGSLTLGAFVGKAQGMFADAHCEHLTSTLSSGAPAAANLSLLSHLTWFAVRGRRRVAGD